MATRNEFVAMVDDVLAALNARQAREDEKRLMWVNVEKLADRLRAAARDAVSAARTIAEIDAQLVAARFSGHHDIALNARSVVCDAVCAEAQKRTTFKVGRELFMAAFPPPSVSGKLPDAKTLALQMAETGEVVLGVSYADVAEVAHDVE